MPNPFLRAMALLFMLGPFAPCSDSHLLEAWPGPFSGKVPLANGHLDAARGSLDLVFPLGPSLPGSIPAGFRWRLRGWRGGETLECSEFRPVVWPRLPKACPAQAPSIPLDAVFLGASLSFLPMELPRGEEPGLETIQDLLRTREIPFPGREALAECRIWADADQDALLLLGLGARGPAREPGFLECGEARVLFRVLLKENVAAWWSRRDPGVTHLASLGGGRVSFRESHSAEDPYYSALLTNELDPGEWIRLEVRGAGPRRVDGLPCAWAAPAPGGCLPPYGEARMQASLRIASSLEEEPVTLEGLFQGVADGWESAEGENIHCQYPGTIEPRFLPGSLRTGVGRTHFLWFHASRPPWGTGLLGPDKGAPAARPATGLRIRYPSGWEEAIEVSGREEGKGDGSAPAPLDRIRTFDGRGRVLREVRVREDGVTRTDHRYQGLDPRPAETLTEVLALPPGDLSPGAAPRPRAGEAQGASGTAAAEAPRPFFPGLPEGSPRFGIGIKVPGLDAMYGDALDLLKSCGHTMGYLKDEEGAVVGWMSFGPNESLGTANKHRFRFFGVEGDAKWPLSGRMSFWEVPITREQLTTGLEALEHFNAHPPRFSPDMHCTSAVQRLATRMAVPIPTGEGMVVIRGYGVTWYSTQASNPYHLAQALTKTYGPPLVMSAARFVHDFFRHKWGAGRSGGELSSAGP